MAGPITKASNANAAITQLVQHVLCPALRVVDLDRPTGGASAYYSSNAGWWLGRHFGGGRAEYPRGVASVEDSNRILTQWASELRHYRGSLETDAAKQRLIPNGIYVPPRNLDICEEPGLAHVTPKQVKKVLQHGVKSPYIVDAEMLPVNVGTR